MCVGKEPQGGGQRNSQAKPSVLETFKQKTQLGHMVILFSSLALEFLTASMISIISVSWTSVFLFGLVRYIL